MSYITPQLNGLILAVKKACSGLNRDFNEIEKLQTSMKGSSDFALSAYRRVEKSLEIELERLKPEYPMIKNAEELPSQNSFLISAIDGIENFAKGIPYFAVCVAMIENQEITASIIFSPGSNELFFAQKGKGCYKEGARNHERLRVSSQKESEKALVGTNFFFKNMEKVGAFRICGCNAMDFAYCASGRFDACVLNNVSAATLAAGLLLLKEAGGYTYETKQTDIREQNLDLLFSTKNVLLTNYNLNKKLSELIQE